MFKPGWLKKITKQTYAEVLSWSLTKHENMFCCNGHEWGEVSKVSQTQVLQTCSNCCRQRVKFNWAEDWTMVARGSETKIGVRL